MTVRELEFSWCVQLQMSLVAAAMKSVATRWNIHLGKLFLEHFGERLFW